jgi:hypothetical protein
MKVFTFIGMLSKYYLDIIQVDEFPAFEMGTNSNVHVLDGRALHPPTRILQCLYPPHPSSPIESKEIYENAVHLLFHLKVKAQIYILKSSKEVFILVHKCPSRLYQSQFLIVLKQKKKKDYISEVENTLQLVMQHTIPSLKSGIL